MESRQCGVDFQPIFVDVIAIKSKSSTLLIFELSLIRFYTEIEIPHENLA